MRWRPLSRLFSVIHSKLGGYTHWVHLWCTQWILDPKGQNAGLQSISQWQSTDFWSIRRIPLNMPKEDNRRLFLLNCSEFRSNDSTGVFSKRPLPKSKTQVGPRIFGLIISKSTQRLGACGGQISPGFTRRLEGLAKGFGPIISQGHPFMGQGRNCWQK
jgi:hypothetical protein